MSLHIHNLLNGTAKRNPLNILTLAQAENSPWVSDTNWVHHGAATIIPEQTAANSISSPFNGYRGAPTSPWAFGNHLKSNASGTYFQDGLGETYGTDLLLLSIFVRQSNATPATIFTLGFEDLVPANGTHGHRFSWSATANNWILSTNFGGGRGYVDPTHYDNGWRRVGIVYQVAWDTGSSDTSVTTGTFGLFMYPGSLTEVDAWGLMMERRTAVTAMSTADCTAYARNIMAEPYLIGLAAENRPLGPLVFDTVRADYGRGEFHVSMKNTPNAGLALLGRVSEFAPWELQTTMIVEGVLNGDGAKTAAQIAYPQMRLAITELNNGTTTLGAWYSE